jgi:hypothetical protein
MVCDTSLGLVIGLGEPCLSAAPCAAWCSPAQAAASARFFRGEILGWLWVKAAEHAVFTGSPRELFPVHVRDIEVVVDTPQL